MEKEVSQKAGFFNVVEKMMVDAVSGGEKYEMVDCRLEHTFTPGLYSRKIFMPKGAIVLSEKHKTRHQFVILDGVVSVFTEKEGWQILSAPYSGITEPGTQRLLKMESDVIWQTFHATELTTVEEVYESIIEQNVNPWIEGKYKNNVFIPEQKLIK